MTTLDLQDPSQLYFCEFPGMNASFFYNDTRYTHIGVRDLTVELQYQLVNDELGANVTGRHYMQDIVTLIE